MNKKEDSYRAPYDARGISNLILDQSDEAGLALTNMAINKIIYFAHAWFLVLFDRPLVIQPFEAWQHGPLIQDVYHEFKTFGDKPITDRARRLDRINAAYVVCESYPHENEVALLRKLTNHYGLIPAAQLRKMTHVAGGPWERVWNYDGKSNPGMVIANDLIVDYYRKNLPTGVADAHPESADATTLRALH